MSIVHVVHFWSPTCGPCMTIKPSIEMLKEDLAEKWGDQIDWISINTKDDPKGRAVSMGITVVPTFVVFKGDVEVGRYSGTQIAILIALINKAFAA
jgi:thiol-disulfide isomerase/thioredoxin